MRGNMLNVFAILLIACLLLFTPFEFGIVASTCVAVAWGLLSASVLCVTRDIVNSFKFATTLYPVAVTADKAKDVGVDIIDFDSAAFLVNAGAIAGSGVVLPVAQECDELAGTYTDVAADDLDGAFVNLAANSVQKVGYKGTKRFLAIRMDYVSGTSVVCGGMIISGHSHSQKVA